jgi:hypothetical protein
MYDSYVESFEKPNGRKKNSVNKDFEVGVSKANQDERKGIRQINWFHSSANENRFTKTKGRTTEE